MKYQTEKVVKGSSGGVAISNHNPTTSLISKGASNIRISLVSIWLVKALHGIHVHKRGEMWT